MGCAPLATSGIDACTICRKPPPSIEDSSAWQFAQVIAPFPFEFARLYENNVLFLALIKTISPLSLSFHCQLLLTDVQPNEFFRLLWQERHFLFHLSIKPSIFHSRMIRISGTISPIGFDHGCDGSFIVEYIIVIVRRLNAIQVTI